MSEIAKRVERGIALLDSVLGTGWRGQVNKDVLDMWSSDLCVIGQVYDGDYLEGIVELGVIGVEVQFAHGFEIDYDNASEYSIDLRTEWLKRL